MRGRGERRVDVAWIVGKRKMSEERGTTREKEGFARSESVLPALDRSSVAHLDSIDTACYYTGLPLHRRRVQPQLLNLVLASYISSSSKGLL